MSNKTERNRLFNLFRYFIALLILVFFLSQTQLGSAVISQTQPPPEFTQPPPIETSGPITQRSTCGKLVFLTEVQSGAKTIGLKLCSSGEVLVFQQHPAELFNYYTFYGMTVANGSDFNDVQYGRLHKYITSFTGYIQVANCSSCGVPMAPVASDTLPPPPSDTPIPAPVETQAPPVETEGVAPPAGILLSTECISYTARIVGQAFNFPKVQFLADKSGEILAQAPGADVCGDDSLCLQNVQLKTLFNGMINTSFEVSPGVRPVGQVMGAISKLFDDPDAQRLCTLPGTGAWELALQFSIKGTAIDAFALHSPARLRVIDKDGKTSGFDRDGKAKNEIPDASVKVLGDSQYIFVPGGQVDKVEIEGVGEGVMTFEAIRNTGSKVQDMGFDSVPVDGQTNATLNTSGSSPYLEIQAGSSGQLASSNPTRFQEYDIEASVAPASATPNPTETSTPTSTPKPSGLNLDSNTQLLIGIILVVVVVIFLGLIALAVIYSTFIRKRTQ
jgi:hypothetical protein